MNPKLRNTFGIALACLWLGGCASLTAPPFDQTALDQAVAAKSAALALVGKASEPYAQHQAEVTALRTQVDTAAAYASSRPHNELAAKQWQILNDPNANLLGGVLKRWQAQGPLSPAFITEAQGVVGEGFDKIIDLEQARKH